MKKLNDVIEERTVQLRNADALTELGFTQLPNSIIRAGKKLSPHAKITFAALLSYAWQDGFCFPAQERLANDIGITDRAVRKFLAELEEKGLIQVKKRGQGKPNIYYIDAKAKILRG